MKLRTILLAALLFGACAPVDFSKDLAEGETTASQWLTPLPDNLPLTGMSIPGAHDAGSSTISAFPLWTRTQELNIAELWNCGIRAFDIRTAYVDGNLGIYHDKYGAGVTYQQVLSALLLALERNPGEFAIVIIRHEREADGNSPEWEMAMAECHVACAEHLLSYRKTLTLGEMRGKLLILVRADNDGPASALGRITDWSSSQSLENQQKASIINTSGSTDPLWVQDWYDPNDSDSKWLAVKDMLDAGADAPYGTLVINHTSGYIGSLPDYRSVAKVVAPRAADYISSMKGPAGIVMADFAGVKNTLGTTVAGDALVDAVIRNN